MPTPAEDPREKNQYVLDAESATEMVRLTIQDQLVTRHMGGLFPPQVVSTQLRDVLDIACGPGGWVLDVAYTHPRLQVTGVDISRTLIEYARARALTQNLSDNATFSIMDATQPFQFPENSFDFVNARFLFGFMRPPAWQPLVNECVRVARPGSWVRLTECDDMGATTSPAFEKLYWMCATAFYRAKRSYSADGRNFNIIAQLRHFLLNAGCDTVEIIPHVIDYSFGTEAHSIMYENWMAGLKLLQPFLIGMKMTTQEEADELYEQALDEMRSSDFHAVWYFLSAVGHVPS